METGMLLRLLSLVNLVLIAYRPIISKKENCIYETSLTFLKSKNVDLPSDIYGLISFKLYIMTQITKVYIFMPV